MLRKFSVIVGLLSVCMVALAQNGKRGKEQKAATTETRQNYKEIGAPLPTVNFYRRDGVYITNKDLDNDASLMIMLFNPTCEHCEQQTALFEQNIGLFNRTNLLLIAAPGMGSYLQYFVNNTKADTYPQLQIGLDSSRYIEKTFRYETLPQINIYDRNRKLVRVFTGNVAIDTLKAYIE